MDDRLGLRIVLTILACLALLYACNAHAAPAPALVPGDYCDARGEPRTPWTAEAKDRTRQRVSATTDALGVAPIIAAYHQLVVCREAFCGEASVRHLLGEDVLGREDGLGAYGLSLRWQAGKWGPDADPGFCSPEVSAVVAHELVWRAVTRYDAGNLVEVQSVYAGAVECRDGRCRFTLSARRRRGFCARLSGYGFDCATPISVADLGRRLAPDERRALALGLARTWMASWLGRLSST
jgi:hypothetical protein